MVKMSNDLPILPRMTTDSHIILHIRYWDLVFLTKELNSSINSSNLPKALKPSLHMQPQSNAWLEQYFESFVVRQVIIHLLSLTNASSSTLQTQTDNSPFFNQTCHYTSIIIRSTIIMHILESL